MSFDQIAVEALRLPAKDRALLAESLWESLGDPCLAAAPADDPQAISLALERDQQLESGAALPLAHADMMARLRS